MAVQKIKGQEGTVYVIKGNANPASQAQYWSQLVSQQKNELVANALKIAMSEEKQAAKSDLERAKLFAKEQQELAKRRDRSLKELNQLGAKEEVARQREQIAKMVTITEPAQGASSGTRGTSTKATPAAVQAREETKLLVRYKELSAKYKTLENEERELERLFREDGETTMANNKQANAKSYAEQAKFYTDRIEDADGVNGDGVITQQEIGKLLPPGSYGTTEETTETEAKKDKKGRRYKAGKLDSVDLTSEKDRVQAEIDKLDSQLKGLTIPEPTARPTLLARTAEIAGRGPSMGQVEERGPSTTEDLAGVEAQMMEKYFPNREFDTNAQGQPTSLEEDITAEELLPPFEMPLSTPVEPDPKAQTPLAPTAGDFTGDLTGADPAAPPSAMQNRMLNRTTDFPEQAPQPQAPQPQVDQPGFNPLQNVMGMESLNIPQEAMLGGEEPQAAVSPELELYNQLLGTGQQVQAPDFGQGVNTKADNQFKEVEKLNTAVKAGRTKTKQEVRKQLESAENTEWASVVTKLYSPPPNASAMQRTRLRDNAYQQLQQTYEDQAETLAKATEFLISLDALEMGALTSE